MSHTAPKADPDVIRGRPTRRRLHAFVAARRSDHPTLVVHSHDLDHAALFPNRRHISPRARRPEDMAAEPPYADALAAEPEGSWPMVVCTGLLEHVPDPAETTRALARALAPGGELILSASGVFPYHGRRSYFHFGPDGLRAIIAGVGLELVEMEGSTRTLETLSGLSRRAAEENDAPVLVRAALSGLSIALDGLNRLTGSPSGAGARGRIGSMPATLMARARKASA